MFRTTIPLGRYAGVAVGAHWSVVIVLALISWLLGASVLPAAAPGYAGSWYWITGALTAVFFLVSLLAHELTHAVLARHHGMGVKRITLWMLGGVAELEGEPPSAKADLLIAASGPAISLLLGGLFLGGAYLAAAVLPPLALSGLGWLGLTNLILGVFNLLPGAPLDGGRVLRAAVWHFTGDRARAAAIAAKVGQVLGVLFIALGLAETFLLGQWTGLWLAFLGWFLMGAAQAELTGGLARRRLGDLRARAIMDPHPVPAAGWFTVQGFLDQTAGTVRHRLFPVLSFDGRPIGVVSLAELARMSPDQRLVTRLSDVCRPPQLVDAGERVADLLTKVSLRPGTDLLLVVEQGRLAGTISSEDLARALELAALRGQDHNVPA
ncbi:site-2 protease family protein [Amycolatopsis cynarae]|uniref:Zinc metalloprotease n=1 Tax=Amycolatopsis cynarae TaxID=2995223 RepID=A0ABY7BDH7_9PSEU|nr:site-2 protease family protein [Amycolatopsis sp. HUAS 11-8]WAL68971.1 site-2 protease family protein [Amycolatopsis sp. HUAS 11-8]